MKAYQAKTTTKKIRTAKIQEKIKQCIADDKKAANRGLDYGTGIALEPAAAAAALPASSSTAEALPAPTTKVICNRCGLAGHARVTNKKCKFYSAPKKRNVTGHIKDSAVVEKLNAISNANDKFT